MADLLMPSRRAGEVMSAPVTLRVNGTTTMTIEDIATTNQGKLAEFKALGLELNPRGLAALDEMEVQPSSKQLVAAERGEYLQVAMEIASKKAEAAFRLTGKPTLIEDTALFVSAARARTGPLIKAWTIPDVRGHFPDSAPQYSGLEDLCFLARRRNDNTAVATVVLAAFDGTQYKIYADQLMGQLPESPRGDQGFGWDSIFIPNPMEQLTRLWPEKAQALTFAEMDQETKLKHFPFRGLVVAKMRKDLVHGSDLRAEWPPRQS